MKVELKANLNQDIEMPIAVMKLVKSQFWSNIHGIFADEKPKDQATLWCLQNINKHTTNINKGGR